MSLVEKALDEILDRLQKLEKRVEELEKIKQGDISS